MPEVAPRFLELGIDLEEAFEVLEEFK